MKRNTKIKKNLKKLVFAALMTAMSVVIGMFCKSYLTFGAIRITFDNLPVLISGIFLGPVYGLAVGTASDLITAPITGSVNPLITVGAASVGLISGVLRKIALNKNKYFCVLLAVLPSHIIGSMVIKSLGLWYFYGYTLPLILPRIPLYMAIGLIESYIIYIIIKNPQFAKMFGGNKNEL